MQGWELVCCQEELQVSALEASQGNPPRYVEPMAEFLLLCPWTAAGFKMPQLQLLDGGFPSITLQV